VVRGHSGRHEAARTGVGEDVEGAARLGVGLEDGAHGPESGQHDCWRPVSSRLGDAATHSAVRHGTVDFSTTILEEVETSAIRRVASWR
jgi:hypothetical protein